MTFFSHPRVLQKHLKNERPPQSSLEKAFEEDDFFTVEEFDEILQSSQSPAKTSPVQTKQNQPSTSKCNRDYKQSENSEKLYGETSVGSFEQPGPSRDPCTFGLLGEDWGPPSECQRDETVRNFFNIIPDEVLENILGQLPILDLCLTAATVCKRWNAIISGKLVCVPLLIL